VISLSFACRGQCVQRRRRTKTKFNAFVRTDIAELYLVSSHMLISALQLDYKHHRSSDTKSQPLNNRALKQLVKALIFGKDVVRIALFCTPCIPKVSGRTITDYGYTHSKGIIWLHCQCKHAKKFEPLDHCHLYRGQQEGHCHDELRAVHTNWITAPTLCVPCFRKSEDKISAHWADAVASRVESLEVIANILRLEDDQRRRERYLRRRENVEGELVDLKLERKLAIANFRSLQGVWGDG